MNTSPTAKKPLCPGPGSICTGGRRGFLQAGLAGFATLSLPGILRLQAQNTVYAAESARATRDKNAVIMVWQPGGCSHLETYDPKPDAGSEAMSESSCRAPRGGWGRRVPKDQLGTQEIRRGG